MTTILTRKLFAVSVLGCVLVSAGPALAGPPLLCHPFDIGGAASLPWGNPSSWTAERADYDVSRLVADTGKMLAPATPVIVRMETLRRAAIYASRDAKVAAALLTTLTDRVHTSNQSKAPDALAYFDAAYLIEAFRQIGMFSQADIFRDRAARVRGLVEKLDGYALIQKSLVFQPGNPALEFAAALIASDRHRGAYQQHAERARAGAEKDPLLARNLKQLT
jgi:hypothetical protein